ncbi:hypothetical protein [Streptosporangium sp. KLBMP 9127]|nr:hypothetical protein [Streptosporangium sp. KLBMP 9127]
MPVRGTRRWWALGVLAVGLPATMHSHADAAVLAASANFERAMLWAHLRPTDL